MDGWEGDEFHGRLHSTIPLLLYLTLTVKNPQREQKHLVTLSRKLCFAWLKVGRCFHGDPPFSGMDSLALSEQVGEEGFFYSHANSQGLGV